MAAGGGGVCGEAIPEGGRCVQTLRIEDKDFAVGNLRDRNGGRPVEYSGAVDSAVGSDAAGEGEVIEAVVRGGRVEWIGEEGGNESDLDEVVGVRGGMLAGEMKTDGGVFGRTSTAHSSAVHCVAN